MSLTPAVYVWNATVLSVHDADTFNCRIDRGWFTYTEVPIRLVGTNAAELSTPGGKAAAEYVRALLPPGTPVRLASARPDKFNPRIDASIAFADASGAEADLATHLIATQWAVPWNGAGKAPVPPWPRDPHLSAER